MPTHPPILTLATCITTGTVILATLTQADAGKYTLNFNKTRPEFANPDRPISVPSVPISSPNPATTGSGDTTNTLDTPDTPDTPRISPFNPPDAGVEGLGNQPIVPSINTLPGTERPEFRVPDLTRPVPTP